MFGREWPPSYTVVCACVCMRERDLYSNLWSDRKTMATTANGYGIQTTKKKQPVWEFLI